MQELSLLSKGNAVFSSKKKKTGGSEYPRR
jgi:hypothetical protein